MPSRGGELPQSQRNWSAATPVFFDVYITFVASEFRNGVHVLDEIRGELTKLRQTGFYDLDEPGTFCERCSVNVKSEFYE